MSIIVKCANCGCSGPAGEAEQIHDFWSRCQPGEIIPHGECPDCGALVYAVPVEQTIDKQDMLKAIDPLQQAALHANLRYWLPEVDAEYHNRQVVWNLRKAATALGFSLIERPAETTPAPKGWDKVEPGPEQGVKP